MIFANNSICKQNIKNPEHPFVDLGKKEMCAKFQQKILNSMVVGAQFFIQKTWFLENNRDFSKSLSGVLHYLISNIKS